MDSVPEPSCFVIAPIGDRNEEVGTEERTRYEEGVQLWEQVIHPACLAVGLKPLRADMLQAAGEIPEQVFRHLYEDDIVIADLTGGNPNVMYELGLRHTRDKLTVQLGESRRLPFDVVTIRTILFKRTEGGLIEARTSLIQRLEAGLAGEIDRVSATRIWLSPEAPGVEEQPITEESEPGYLELLAKSEEALPQISTILVEMTRIGSEVSDLFTSAVEQVAQSDAAGKGMSGRLAIAVRLASDLEQLSLALEDLSLEYEGSMKSVDPGISYLIGRLEEDANALKDEEVREFLSSLGELASSTTEMTAQVEANSELVAGLGDIARPLRAPSKRVADAWLRVTRASVVITNWQSRAGRLIVPEAQQT
jgi:hypothetical protein